MCGRITLRKSTAEVADAFDAPCEPDLFTPRFNVSPTAEIPAIRLVDGSRRIDLLRWWLLPSWSEKEKQGYPTFNARSETAAEKPAFRGPFKSRRCLIPVDGFYEWRKFEKTPFFIRRRDDGPFALAGLWDRWERGGKVVESCTILTTTPNDLMATMHGRMPCILDREAWDYWLDPTNKDVDELRSLLAPREWPGWEAYPVSTKVNKPGPDGEELIARAG
jgi:putative SOS response-associated peptidase YedK